MANTVVLGMQWGDEGKGKIVDLLSPAFDAVVRFQGGHNAGHTVKFRERHFALHFLPSGVLLPAMRCYLGNGMVIEPEAFFSELAGIEEAGIAIGDRLHISDRAHVILPTHVALDRAREAARGEKKIGTTTRGIGPAYEAKAARCGVRIGDLTGAALAARLEVQESLFAPQLEALGAAGPPPREELEGLCRGWGERLAPYLCDVGVALHGARQAGHSVLFEGAQGALLDLDHGTYPFVTSSSASAGGVCTGAGVPPTSLDGVIGVLKAYATRVGEGPFVTELEDATGAHLRRRGNEFGTTTGRPRRCGWFDAVAARYARRLNGVDVLALTKLDVLDELAEIRVCTSYRYGDQVLDELPGDLEVLRRAEPVYRTLPGWRRSTDGLLQRNELPAAARDYVTFLEEVVEAPVGLISSGPRREETILVEGPELDAMLGGRLDRVLAHRDAA